MDDGGANKPQPEPIRDGATNALTPERWQQIKNTFGLALECEPDRQSALLQEVCAGDESLRADVQSLLDAAEGNGAATSEVFQAVSQRSSAQLPPREADDPMLGRRNGACVCSAPCARLSVALIKATSFTGTSSPTTFLSPMTARPSCWTSASPRCWVRRNRRRQ